MLMNDDAERVSLAINGDPTAYGSQSWGLGHGDDRCWLDIMLYSTLGDMGLITHRPLHYTAEPGR